MNFKALVIALFTICSAEHRIIVPKRLTARAIPAEILNDNDFVHTYDESDDQSTPSPVLGVGPLIPNMYHKIQYAPLQSETRHNHKHTATEHSPSVSPTVYEQTKGKIYKKDHLEPRVPVSQSSAEIVYKCPHISGNNGNVSPTVSRSPGHNAVYRNSLEIIDGINPFKPDFMARYEMYPNLQLLSTAMTPHEIPYQKLAKPFRFSNERHALNLNSIEDGLQIEKVKRQHSPYSRLHRLHLNIARVYSPGQVPPKPPVFADTFSMNVGSRPGHLDNDVPTIFEAISNPKTKLYPIANPNRYRYHIK